jgi:phosphoribosyl 1,2-cyclic phosphodiesterase
MLQVTFLGSSSRGNCAVLHTNDGIFLIDAGLSGKKIREKLDALGIDVHQLAGVFITHEHQDHVLGLKTLCQIPGFRCYANAETAKAIEKRYSIKAQWHCFTTGQNFPIQSLHIQTFPVEHDAVCPVGYLFKTAKYSLAWATDLGRITETVASCLLQAKQLALESNHDEQLLWQSQRPLYLKQRIAQNHLSNQEAYAFIASHIHQWDTVHLIHLSAECNQIATLKDQLAPLNHPIHIAS